MFKVLGFFLFLLQVQSAVMNPTGLWSLVSPPPLSPNSRTVESQNFHLSCHLLIHWRYSIRLLLDLFLSLCPCSCVSGWLKPPLISFDILLYLIIFLFFLILFFLVYIQSALPPRSPYCLEFWAMMILSNNRKNFWLLQSFGLLERESFELSHYNLNGVWLSREHSPTHSFLPQRSQRSGPKSSN